MPSIKVIIALLSIYFIWGSTFTAIKIGVEEYPPFFFASIRFMASGLIFFVIAYFKEFRRLRLAEIGRAAIIGFLLTFSNALVCWAEMGLDSGLAALIITSVPLFLVGLNTFSFEKKIPSQISILGLAISISGLFVIFYPAMFISGLQNQLPFMLLLVFSAFTWATGSLLQKTTSKENPIPFFQNLALQVFIGGLSLFLLSMLIGENIPNLLHTSLESSLSILYLALFGTVIAYSCYIYILRNTSAEIVSTYALVNPVIAILFGVVFLGEVFNLRLAYASLLVLSGVGVIIFESKIKLKLQHIRFKKTKIEIKKPC